MNLRRPQQDLGHVQTASLNAFCISQIDFWKSRQQKKNNYMTCIFCKFDARHIWRRFKIWFGYLQIALVWMFWTLISSVLCHLECAIQQQRQIQSEGSASKVRICLVRWRSSATWLDSAIVWKPRWQTFISEPPPNCKVSHPIVVETFHS